MRICLIRIAVLLATYFVSAVSYGQLVQNGDFETWYTAYDGTDSLASWINIEGPNPTDTPRHVVKSDDAHSGAHCVRITPWQTATSSSIFPSYGGIRSVTDTMTVRPLRLRGYYRFEKDSSTLFAQIAVCLFDSITSGTPTGCDAGYHYIHLPVSSSWMPFAVDFDTSSIKVAKVVYEMTLFSFDTTLVTSTYLSLDSIHLEFEDPDTTSDTTTSTSVINGNYKKDYIIYPNPVTASSGIRIFPEPPPTATFQLLDATGRTVPFHHSGAILYLEGIPPGLYILHLSDGGRRHTVKVIRQ